MKKLKFTQFGVALALVVTSVFATPSLVATTSVFADDSSSKSNSSPSTAITVSPMNQRIILSPGETTQGSIQVSNPNTSSQKLKFTVSVGSFSQQAAPGGKDDYGVVDVNTVSDYNQMMKWITVGETKGELAPNSSTTIPYTITVPSDAPAGGQYATIIVKNDDDQGSTGGNVAIQSNLQVASIIYAEVTGTTRQSAEILDNSFPSFMLSGPLEATAMVKNDGNIHTDAQYVLQVWPMIGDEEICTNEENPSTSLVMPETKQYHVESCNIGSVGIFRAKQTVTILGEVSVVEHMVILCPIWLMLVIAIVIFLIIFYFVRRSRK